MGGRRGHQDDKAAESSRLEEEKANDERWNFPEGGRRAYVSGWPKKGIPTRDATACDMTNKEQNTP